MTDKWIGKGHLKYGGAPDKDGKIKYGQTIPKSFPKERLAKLKKDRKVGEVIQYAKPEDKGISVLEAQIKGLTADNKELKGEIETLNETIDDLKSDIEELAKEGKSSKKDGK